MGRFRFCGQIWLVSSGKCSLKAAVPETYHFKQTSFDYIKLHAYFVTKMLKITIRRIFCRENYNYAHILSRKRRKLQLRALVGRFSLQNTTVGRLEDYRTGQVLERSGEARARQQNQTVLVPSLLSVQLIHPTQVQTHQLSPSTTVKNGSCHPIQTFQQGGQASRGPCCAAMCAVCHCSTYTAALPC